MASAREHSTRMHYRRWRRQCGRQGPNHCSPCSAAPAILAPSGGRRAGSDATSPATLLRSAPPVRLLAPVGRDPDGDWLLAQLAESGVCRDFAPRLEAPTGSYLALLDEAGELAAAVADMRIMEAFTPAVVDEYAAAFVGAAVVCVDANLSAEALSRVIDHAEQAGAVVIAEPVSVPKAGRLTGLLPRLSLILPSRDELAALAGRPAHSLTEVAEAGRVLRAAGVPEVWTTLGADGVHYATATGEGRQAAPRVEVVDVTGAGDCFTAAAAYGTWRGWPRERTIRFGQRLAAKLVGSTTSVLRREDVLRG